MQKRHKNRQQYFKEQGITTEKYVIPYISEFTKIDKNTDVLEIGCGEGGNLKPFLDVGCKVTGVDISCSRIGQAKEFHKNYNNRESLQLICEDIYNINSLDKEFDIIIMRDVIEHIPNQEKFMCFVKRFLKSDGKIFLAFPPWQNPFGGHQQICENKILSKTPYFHLLPINIYQFVLRIFGEDEKKIEGLLSIKEMGISIERFEQILKQGNYKINGRSFYFINPNYQTKFGLKPRQQIRFISKIPWLRNFFTTAMYYVISE